MNDYEEHGGLKKMLSDHANDVIRAIVEAEPDTARRETVEHVVQRIMTGLTKITGEGVAVRQPQKLSDLASRASVGVPELVKTLQPLAADGVSFIRIYKGDRITGDELVDVSHEALIRNWDTLGQWMDEEKRFQVWHEQTERDLQEYEALLGHLGKLPAPAGSRAALESRTLPPEKALLSGIRLDRAQWWLRDRPGDINAKMREFIEKSSKLEIEPAREGDTNFKHETNKPEAYRPALRSKASIPKVFISYSRRDAAFADAITTSLQRRGVEALIDRRDLPFGEQWAQELSSFIRSADAIISLVSPAYVQSKSCNWELEDAARWQKRIFPVVIQSMSSHELPLSIGHLARTHIEEVSGEAFESKVDDLVVALTTDLQWVKEHTRLSDLAHQWATAGYSGAMLLRGSALKQAERWLAYRTRGGGQATAEQVALIMESRRRANRQTTFLVAGITLASVITSGLAMFAYLESRRADKIVEAARSELHLARRQLDNLAKRNETARSVIDRLKEGDPVTNEMLSQLRRGLRDGEFDQR